MSPSRHLLTSRDREALAALRAQRPENPAPPTRASFDALAERTPPHPDVRYEQTSVASVATTVCIPEGASTTAAILYFHGGAFVLGSARAFRHFVGQLAARARTTAFIADYRLAPEHPFPAAWEDAEAAHAALARDLGAARVALAGDSAGGGLALSRMLAEPSAPCGVLFSPWTDLSLSGPSVRRNAALDPILTEAVLDDAARRVAAGLDRRHPRLSPGLHLPVDGPVLQAHVGGEEILLDDALRLAAVDGADIHVWEGMPHVFPRALDTFEAASLALDIAGAFIRRHLGA